MTTHTVSRRVLLVLAAFAAVAVSHSAASQRPALPADPVATFSILGYDPESGELGGAVQSRVFSVGNGVLWAEAGVGAAATQAIVDVVKAFETTKGRLAFRLQAALEAGQAAGGDTRGMQSAAMLIVKKDGGPWLHNDVVLRLQVDDHTEPITEMRRILTKRFPRG